MFWLSEPAEDYNSSWGPASSEAPRDLNSFVGSGWWHPQGGHDHLGLMLRDRSQERIPVATYSRDMDTASLGEDARQSLASEEAALTDHDPQYLARRALSRGHLSDRG